MTDIYFKLEKPQDDLSIQDDSSLSSESTSKDVDQYPCVSCIDDTILPPQRKLPETTLRKLTRAALVLSVTTLVSSLTLTVLGFVISQDSESSAMFGFAFDSFFALVSACILIWRFSNHGQQNTYKVARRETHATAVVAICMIVSSIAIFIRAIDFLYHSEKPEKPVGLLIITSISLFIYSALFISKYKVAQKLGSGALLTDAIDSFWAAVFSFTILICAVVFEFTTKFWYLDSSVALVIAVCSFGYGTLVLEKLVRLFKKREDNALYEYQKALLAVEEQELPGENK